MAGRKKKEGRLHLAAKAAAANKAAADKAAADMRREWWAEVAPAELAGIKREIPSDSSQPVYNQTEREILHLAAKAAADKATADKAAADKAAADKAAAEELRRRATALGLLQVLTMSNIADDATLKKSIAFCDEQGVTSESDLVEYNLVDDFVRHLGLKNVPGKKLRSMLQAPTSRLAGQLSDRLASPSSPPHSPGLPKQPLASPSSPSLQKAATSMIN
jgi:hypothetical protein